MRHSDQMYVFRGRLDDRAEECRVDWWEGMSWDRHHWFGFGYWDVKTAEFDLFKIREVREGKKAGCCLIL